MTERLRDKTLLFDALGMRMGCNFDLYRRVILCSDAVVLLVTPLLIMERPLAV